MKKSALTLAVGATALLTLSLTSCASDGGGSGDGGGNSASGKCVEGPIKIGLIPKLGTDPYMVTVQKAVEAAAAKDGSTVIYTSPSDATGAAQIPFVNQLISQGVDVIAISGSDLNSASAALAKAKQAGIKVISWDSDVAPDSRAFFLNQADTSKIGDQMLASLSDMIGGEGDFAILSSTQTAVNQNAWIASIKDKLANDAKYSKMKLVTVAYGEEKADVNAQKAKELVQAYPNLKGIIVPAGIGLPAAAEALSQSGDLGRVKISGLGPVTLVKQYIDTGNVQDVWWNVQNLGTLTFATAEQYAQCKIEPKEGTSYDVDGLGKFTVGENGTVLLGEPTIVTPANVKDFPF
ncbi:sugar ABC transporter substrate-binding protein [Mycolicibacterium sp. P1-18]|uniref:substrate-binding domain-containing protein n=1 Tax=Mycolicibacterium sp. P1-18 TaxID=2024615 RepID=UPI0011F143AF|nr:substrate-binding domain-containing protein [Mycolicibacterium sp. P1-18]KAA0099884.1 sugar ABC transporter substrate-binding protein [Mycolicibacterium sp. P1-18]